MQSITVKKIKNLHPFVALLIFSLITPSSFAGLNEWRQYNDAGDYQAALNELKPLILNKNKKAQFLLGMMYYEGRGVTQDYQQAAYWYKKSAEQGDKRAQLIIGSMYFIGRGIPQDYKQAAFWYKMAAEQGSAQAQVNIGNMYRKGQGVIQDYKKAVLWYIKAAEQENATAQNNLGIMYLNGLGVHKSKVIAYALCNLSASIDNSPKNTAISNRQYLIENMTSSEINAGQALTNKLSIKGEFLEALGNANKAELRKN